MKNLKFSINPPLLFLNTVFIGLESYFWKARTRDGCLIVLTHKGLQSQA
jgi:hypothetical protein